MYRIMKNKNWFYVEKQKSFLWFKYWKTEWYEEEEYDWFSDTRSSEFYTHYFKTEKLAKEYIDDKIKGKEKNEFICYYP